MTKVAVIMGGISSEREVSLQTGRMVLSAVQHLGYDAKGIDLTKDVGAFIKQLTNYNPDVVFNALHGAFGEDGCVQGLLNMLKIPYTHSGVMASSIGMDKEQTRRIAKACGVPVAKGGIKTLQEMQKKQFPYPYVAKPNADGSSVGVYIIKDDNDQKKLFKSWAKNESLLIEEYVAGHELCAAVLSGEYLGDLEIITKSGFYDYKNKYTTGMSKHVEPTEISAKMRQLIKKYALTIHKALGCRGVTRCDFRLDDSNPKHPKLVFLEINTNPGMTALSLVPDIAKQKKISYDDIIRKLIAEAKCD